MVHWSCKTGIAPTNKNMKIAEKKEKHKKYVDEQIEKNRLEQEERERSFSESDPEAVKKLVDDCIANLGKTKSVNYPRLKSRASCFNERLNLTKSS